MNNDGGNKADCADRHRNEVIPGSSPLVHAQRVGGIGDRVHSRRSGHYWLGLTLFTRNHLHRTSLSPGP